MTLDDVSARIAKLSGVEWWRAWESVGEHPVAIKEVAGAKIIGHRAGRDARLIIVGKSGCIDRSASTLRETVETAIADYNKAKK